MGMTKKGVTGGKVTSAFNMKETFCSKCNEPAEKLFKVGGKWLCEKCKGVLNNDNGGV
jgi:ribosomal protein L37AE/L43A